MKRFTRMFPLLAIAIMLICQASHASSISEQVDVLWLMIDRAWGIGTITAPQYHTLKIQREKIHTYQTDAKEAASMKEFQLNLAREHKISGTAELHERIKKQLISSEHDITVALANERNAYEIMLAKAIQYKVIKSEKELMP